MKFTHLFLMAGALLSATTMFALDITVKNATNAPLTINKRVIGQITVKGDVNGTIPAAGGQATFTLVKVGDTHHQYACKLKNLATLLENVDLEAANYDWQGYSDQGWKTVIKAGGKSHYWDNSLDHATVTITGSHNNYSFSIDAANKESAQACPPPSPYCEFLQKNYTELQQLKPQTAESKVRISLIENSAHRLHCNLK